MFYETTQTALARVVLISPSAIKASVKKMVIKHYRTKQLNHEPHATFSSLDVVLPLPLLTTQ